MDEQTGQRVPTEQQRGSRARQTIGLTIWLLMPFVVIVLLWLSIDRSQGRPEGGVPPQELIDPDQESGDSVEPEPADPG